MKRENYNTDDNSRMARLHRVNSTSNHDMPPKPPITRYSPKENQQDQQRYIKRGEDIYAKNAMLKKRKRHKVEKIIGIITCIATVVGGFFTYLGYRKNNNATPKTNDTRIEKVYDKTTPTKNSPNNKNKKNNDNDKAKANSSDKADVAKAKAEQKEQDDKKEAQQQQQIQDAIQRSKQATANTNSTVKTKLANLKQQAQDGTLSGKAQNEFNNIKSHLKDYEPSGSSSQDNNDSSNTNN